MSGLYEIGIVGGPKSGKSSIVQNIQEEYPDGQVVFVPEVATLLKDGGYPMPDGDFPLCMEWQSPFQDAVFYTQLAIEEEYRRRARQMGAKVMVKDRTLGCGAAYFRGLLIEFCARYGFTPEQLNKREQLLYHVESLATASPDDFQHRGAGRMEDLDRVRMLEMATREIWKEHPRRIMMMGMGGIASKADRLIGIIKYLLISL